MKPLKAASFRMFLEVKTKTRFGTATFIYVFRRNNFQTHCHKHKFVIKNKIFFYQIKASLTVHNDFRLQLDLLRRRAIFPYRRLLASC